jgi:hypothetical protein
MEVIRANTLRPLPVETKIGGSMIRVPMQSRETVSADEQHIFDLLDRERGTPTAYIFRAMAHTPEILAKFIPMARYVAPPASIRSCASWQYWQSREP